MGRSPALKTFISRVSNPDNVLLISAVAGFGIAILLIGRLAFSGFSILDDHQIAGWLGSQHRVHFSDLWPMLKQTDLGQYGTGQRFRPVMYLDIVLQTWLWRGSPAGFHLVAILWFSIFLWAAAWASFRSVGIIAGCAILFLIANGQYWGNIWTHSVMVSEQTGALGLGLVIFGFGLICSWFVDGCRSRIDTAILLVSAGSVICLGSKENFMALMGLDMLLVAWAWWTGKIGAQTLTICIAFFVVDLAICYGIIVPNFGKQTDFYGYNNSFAYRLSTVRHSPLFQRVLISVLAGGVATILGWRNIARRNDRDDRRMAAWGMLLMMAGMYLAWEIFVYDGRLPMHQRYDFPALLIDPILAGAAFYAILHVRPSIAWVSAQFSPLALQICFALLVLNVASAYLARHHLLSIITAVQISNAHTNLMRDDLTKGKALASQHPDWPIIVSPSNPLDYEAVVTFPYWLQYFDIHNSAAVFVVVPPQNITSPFQKGLVDAMSAESRNGKPGMYEPRNASIQRAQAVGHCYIVTFEALPTHCIVLPYRPAEYYPVD